MCSFHIRLFPYIPYLDLGVFEDLFTNAIKFLFIKPDEDFLYNIQEVIIIIHKL
jgi:hypothetical protein